MAKVLVRDGQGAEMLMETCDNCDKVGILRVEGNRLLCTEHGAEYLRSYTSLSRLMREDTFRASRVSRGRSIL